MQKYAFHLCQPDKWKSCGACCGLYNWEDHSRKALQELLEKRTAIFLSLREKMDVEKYRALVDTVPTPAKLCESIYNCEFIGFIDENKRRVGCLLHPSLHGGIDLRTCSFYGARLCEEHFCIAYSSLSPVEQLAVIVSIHDWYLYGLVVTDVDLVKEFFTCVQSRLGDCVREKDLTEPCIQRVLYDFFTLKETWPFIAQRRRLGKYYFSGAEYQLARLQYAEQWNIAPSRFERILLSLSSEFTTREEMSRAESIIEEKIAQFVEVYQKRKGRSIRYC